MKAFGVFDIFRIAL